jgi:hypothetical protein
MEWVNLAKVCYKDMEMSQRNPPVKLIYASKNAKKLKFKSDILKQKLSHFKNYDYQVPNQHFHYCLMLIL